MTARVGCCDNLMPFSLDRFPNASRDTHILREMEVQAGSATGIFKLVQISHISGRMLRKTRSTKAVASSE